MASANDTPKRLTNFNQRHRRAEPRQNRTVRVARSRQFPRRRRRRVSPRFRQGPKNTRWSCSFMADRPRPRPRLSVFSPQLLASHGYVVFRRTIAAATTIGNAYQRAIFNDAGDGPGRDVMAGIDALKKQGFIDETKIGVTGWSYGGYMTSWLIGHYSRLEGGPGRRARHRPVRRVQPLRRQRHRTLQLQWLAIGRRQPEGLPRAVADHLRVAHQDADADPARHRRRARHHLRSPMRFTTR